MSPSEVLAREVTEWLAKAADDLGGARVLADAGHPALALYHCQQAAEKSLKAFLTAHQKAFRKTHNLKELGESCSVIDPSFAPVAAASHSLKDYAWKLRYPGDPYVIEDGELEAMILLADTTLSEVRSRIANETPPALAIPGESGPQSVQSPESE